MESGVLIQRCDDCGLRNFPAHLVCARCGGRELDTERVFDATIVRLTYSRRRLGATREDGAVVVALIEIEFGPLIVARGEGALQQGDLVKLSMDGTTPVVSRKES